MLGKGEGIKMKCFECGNRLYSRYNYCPNCGKLVSMCSKHTYAMTVADFAQANRIEKKLDDLGSRFDLIFQMMSSKKKS